MRLSANRLVCHLFAFRSLLHLLLPLCYVLLRFFVGLFLFFYLFFICFQLYLLLCCCVYCVFALSCFCRCAIIVSVLLYIFNVRLFLLLNLGFYSFKKA